MVLISIHPFALRRLVLVLLALVGFSALCFADPVLMARRYGAERAPATRTDGPGVGQAARTPYRHPDFQSIDLIPPIFAAKTAASVDKPALPPLSLTPLTSQNWGCDLRIDAFPEIASDSLFTIATNTD